MAAADAPRPGLLVDRRFADRRRSSPCARLRCAAVIGGALLIGAFTPARGSEISRDPAQNEIQIFLEALQVIRKHYVDTAGLEPQALIRGAIRGMIETLRDSHTRYMTPQEADELRKSREGEFGGIGIQIAIDSARLTVITPMEGTPARRAGIEPGDVILKIDDVVSETMTIEQAVAALRGPAGTEVALRLERPGESDPIVVPIVREIIRVRSVRHAMIENLGYLRIASFTELTPEQLDAALKDLTRQRARGLILDLRDNPGGVLEISVAVANRFLDSGVIVSTVGRDPSQTRAYRASGAPGGSSLPLVVLVNGNSAAASEIVAGAVRDLGRGVIVGERTFGKGSVQSVETLRDGSQIALTTARYFTPSGHSIHGVGVTPDSGMIVSRDEPGETEVAEIRRLAGAPFFREFLRRRETWDDADLDALMGKIKAAGIALSRSRVERHLLSELRRRNDARLYLIPRLDPQLQKAVNLLKAALRLQLRR